MMQFNATDLMSQFFYSTEIWGYLGPIALVILAYLITKKDKVFGLFYYVILVVMAYSYLNSGFVAHAWHFSILLFGGGAVCLLAAVDGR
jgi:hypothetical protein